MKTFGRIIILLLISVLFIYTSLPVINWGFSSIAAFLIFLCVLWIILGVPLALDTTNKQKPTLKLKQGSRITYIIIGILIFYLVVVQFFSSSAMFHTQEYRNLIGNVKQEVNLSKHMMPISLEKIRTVDQNLAEILGDKVLGSQTALGSQVQLGTFNIQKVGNDLYWVAPLLHSGFFKWIDNKQGTNGYVMVNACNERDVRLVQTVKGSPVYIRYQPEAYFGDNLERYLYMNGYWNCGLTDYTFEIDDNGIPYWVVTKYKKEIGFGGDNATGIVVLNAQTGDIKEYGIKDAPGWVDRIQPGDFIEKQLNDWGELVNGYWNFSNQGKLATTESVSMVYGEDNNSYWYTGLTSVGADESTVGFVLVNTRTKESFWFKQSGATEYAAQNSAKGKVQEKGYSASQPIPYNINNIPTYVMTLKDQGGLVKMYAMVAIEDYTIVGVGNTLRETLMAYKNAYNQNGNKISTKSQTEKTSLRAVVSRIGTDVKNGNSFYYFTIKGNTKMFIGSTQISSDFPLTNIGDSVYITYDNDSQSLIDVSSFKNTSIR